MKKKKTILVTGGAGFIGSHLCDALLKSGNHVICVDDLSTGDTRNIQHMFKNRDFEFIKHSMRSPIYWGPLDEIYHLACPASPLAYQKDPIGTLMTCADGTRHALEMALKGSTKFLLTSTSEVYGDPEKSPQKEGYNGNVSPIGVRSCYDEGKRFAEALVMAYRRTHFIDTKIARIFNTYGPRMDQTDGRAIPNFIYKAQNSNVVAVYGDGLQTRSFCYVSDMVAGLMKLMASNEHDPVNLGNPEELTILDLANKVIKLTGSKARVVHHAEAEDDPRKRRPDISRAKRTLNWEPKVSLLQGLKKII